MRKSPITVRSLAQEARINVDDALIRLWEAGLEDFLEPDDVVPRASQPAAFDALGVMEPGCVRSIEAWSVRLGLGEEDFRKKLTELGVNVTPNMRNLPRGSVAKVKKMLDSRHLAMPTDVTSSQTLNSSATPTPIDSTFEWQVIGKPRELRYLNETEVRRIHDYLIEHFRETSDPIEPPGVRDDNLIAGAVARPLTAIGQILKYPSAETAAAALLHSLTLDHAFYNGNKRAALVSMLVFLDRNDLALTATEAEVLKVVLRLARHALVPPGAVRSDREVYEIAQWISANMRVFTHGDRPLQFRVLRRILTGFGCTFTQPKRGNRINIHRTVDERGLFGISRPRNLESQIYYKNEGMDVPRNTINKIRGDLNLDEEHGCDSAAFYYNDVEVIDQVVANYQTTLKRLAKL